jgi:Uma2 family endonuclease
MARAQLARLEAEGKLDETLRYEILDGELVIRGAPGKPHEDAVNVLRDHLGSWVRQHGGLVYTGLAAEVGEHQLLPDLSFVGPDRVAEVDDDGFHVAPDLVAEVTSPGSRSLDLDEKRGIYAEVGVAEYWVVDLAGQRVLVHRHDAAGAYQAAEHTAGVLTTAQAPDLEIPVAELFAGDGRR